MISLDESQKIVKDGISQKRLEELIGGSSSMPAFDLGEGVYRKAESDARILEGRQTPQGQIFSALNFYQHLIWQIERAALENDFKDSTIDALTTWREKLEALCLKYKPRPASKPDRYEHRDVKMPNARSNQQYAQKLIDFGSSSGQSVSYAKLSAHAKAKYKQLADDIKDGKMGLSKINEYLNKIKEEEDKSD